HRGDDRAHDTAEPLRTVTTANGGEFAMVQPYVVSVAHGDSGGRREYGPVEPLGTVTQYRQHAVVSPYLVPRYGERPTQEPRTHSVEDPMPTVVPTVNGGSLVAAF